MSFTILASYVEIADPANFKPSDLETLPIYTIGGNHTRAAGQGVDRKEFPNFPKHMMTKVYANIDYLSALDIGNRHNQMHQNAKKETFFDETERFRRVLYHVNGVPGTQNPKPTNPVITETWKLQITDLEGFKNVSI